MNQPNCFALAILLCSAFPMAGAAQSAQEKASNVPKLNAGGALRPFGRVTNTASSRATAKSKDRAITFTIVTAPNQEAARIGQPVMLSVDGKTVAYVKFPLQIPTAIDKVGEGPGKGKFRMETRSAKVSNTGLISGKTHTISEDAIEGFTGQVWLKLMDRDGNDIAVERMGCFGVNLRSGRDDVWRKQLDSLMVRKAARAEIWHARSGCGKDRWNEVLEKAKKGAEVIGALVKAAAADSSSSPTQPQPDQ